MNRVENSAGKGMPDVEGCLRDGSVGHQFWLELKWESRPSDPKTKIKPKFRPQQIPWLHKRAKAGGRCYVLLQVGSGHDARRYLIPGDVAGSLANGWSEEKLAKISATCPKSAPHEIIADAALYYMF